MTTTNVKAPTLQQQLNAAVKHAGEVLDLDDLKVLSLALVEAATNRLDLDGTLAETVRLRYEEIAKRPHPTKPNTQGSNTLPQRDLVPLKKILGREFNIAAPLDPFFLLELYGDAQLSLALSRCSLKQLREGAAAVKQRFPGTKPKPRATKEDLIDYIVAVLTK